MSKSVEEYICEHSGEIPEVLEWLEKQTVDATGHHSRMLAGPVLGKIIIELSKLIKPKRVLEIGAFTGYSAICLAQGLSPGGQLDIIEKNETHRELIEEAFKKAGIIDSAVLHFGDAKTLIPAMEGPYDLVYIDANKREYCTYYNLVFDLVKPGGYILADNVLWYGKVAEETPSNDAQTQEILKFNRMVKDDRRVSGFILPLRDGLYIIKKL